MDLWDTTLRTGEWRTLIHSAETGQSDEPVVDVDESAPREFDAIRVREAAVMKCEEEVPCHGSW